MVGSGSLWFIANTFLTVTVSGEKIEFDGG